MKKFLIVLNLLTLVSVLLLPFTETVIFTGGADGLTEITLSYVSVVAALLFLMTSILNLYWLFRDSEN